MTDSVIVYRSRPYLDSCDVIERKLERWEGKR
jgi:hypothetical protein